MAGLTPKAVKEALNTHCMGRCNALRVGELVEVITGCRGNSADARVVRRLVQQLRQEGEPICSHSVAGYWIPNTVEELDVAISHLRIRALGSLVLIRGMRRHRARLLGQLPLTGD